MKLLTRLILLCSAASLSGQVPVDDYTQPPTEEMEKPAPPPPVDTFLDLEESAQDFVLETKQIVIEGHPFAFNPSIVRFRGSLLFFFRTYDPKTRATNQIGLTWLDDDFNPIGKPQFLQFSSNDPYALQKRQDPRLIPLGERLFVAYNNVLQEPKEREIRRMVLAEVKYDGETFTVEDSDCFIKFEGERRDRSEKNWVPFEYQGEILFAYSLVPHRILQPLHGRSECSIKASTLSKFKWDWGVLRGGTPALLDNGEYLAFFHCSKSMRTVHSKGESIPHYFMGAYTFSAHPPFHLTQISPRPIVGKRFYHGPAHKTWKPLVVVFPCGLVMDENYIWVVYGRQDHETWVVKLDKKGLYQSLVPVSQQ